MDFEKLFAEFMYQVKGKSHDYYNGARDFAMLASRIQGKQTETDTGICPVCHKAMHIKKDGTLIKHGQSVGVAPCDGSGKRPIA